MIDLRCAWWKRKRRMLRKRQFSCVKVRPSQRRRIIVTTTTRPVTASWCVNVLVLEGITTGDVVASGILSTRHARTLSYLFQSSSSSSSSVPTETTPPTLLLTVVTSEDDKEQEDSKNSAWDPEALLQDIRTLFQVATSSSSSLQLEDVYNVQIVPISTTQVRLGSL